MASTDLRFSSPYAPGQPTHLVFGDDGNTLPPGTAALHADGKVTGMRGSFVLRKTSAVHASGRVTGMRGSFALHAGFNAHAAGQITGMRGGFKMRWDADVARGPRAALEPHWQQAAHASGAAGSRWNEAQRVQGALVGHWQPGAGIAALAVQPWQQAALLRGGADLHWQESRAVRGAVDMHWQEALRLRAAAAQHWQEGQARRSAIGQRWEEALRLRSAAEQHWQESVQARASLRTGYGFAEQLHITLRQHWQEAVRPMPAPKRDVPPEQHTCWSPDLPANLLFQSRWVDGLPAHLVFACGGSSVDPEPGDTVVVPIRRVYMTINTALLFRVDNGYAIPASGLRMSLDWGNWTWNFSASVRGYEYDKLRDVDDKPVQVRAFINGAPYDFVIEKVGPSRSFNNVGIEISGRGLSAELDDLSLTFGNAAQASAFQLMNQVLTINSASIGWSIDQWEPTDWSVPAGVFSHNGTHISALNRVAEAAGAYIQPHDSDRKLDVLLKYPLPHWDWNTVTPDIELPANVVSFEGIEFATGTNYNRVYVVGQEHGVLGQYTRRGTPGDIVAPTVVDPLITGIEAVRQRGRSIICAGGTTVSLKLPVLAETGVIKPGKFIRYVDNGVARIGISRSVSVDVNMPTIYQTIGVETRGY